jgi:molybdate transport system permease protein
VFSSFELEVIALSVKVAATAIVLIAPLAIGLGYLFARYEFPGKSVLESVIMLPLVLPPVVLGYFLLLTFGKEAFLGKFLLSLGIELVFDWKGAAISCAIVSLPLFFQSVKIAVQAIDPSLERMAETLGAGRFRIIWHQTLPLAKNGIAAGIVLAFSRSLGEFGATITFVANLPGKTQTLPLAIYSLMQTPNGTTEAMRLCLFSSLLAIAATLTANALMRNREN